MFKKNSKLRKGESEFAQGKKKRKGGTLGHRLASKPYARVNPIKRQRPG